MTKHELIEAYVAGRIDRRDFVRRLTALGVSGGAALAYAQSLTPVAAAAGVARDAHGYLIRAQGTGDYGTGGEFGSVKELIDFLVHLLDTILAYLERLLGGLTATTGLRTGEMLATGHLSAPTTMGNRFTASLQTGNTLTTSDLRELATLRNQLSQHVAALRTALSDFGGTPSEAPTAAPTSTASSTAVTAKDLTALAAVLNGLVGVYADVIPTVTGSGPKTAAFHRTLTQIALVEARQAAFVNRLIGESAFPETFEPASTKSDVQQLLGGLGG